MTPCIHWAELKYRVLAEGHVFIMFVLQKLTCLWGVAIAIRKLFMPNSFELLLLILQTISTKSVPNILFKLSIRYIVNACWSSEVKTAGSIRVRSLVEGVTKLGILGIYQKDDSI